MVQLQKTLELQNSRTSPWQLVIAGPDQDGHKAELVAEAERLGLRVEDKCVNALMQEYGDEITLPDENKAIRHSGNKAFLTDLIFTGPVFGKEKDDLYAKADLFVLPTYSENFGVVVVEALAHGCPVITTKGTPWQELLGSPASSKVLKCESAKVEGGTTANGANPANEDNFRTLECSNFRTSRCGWWIDIGVEPLAQALNEAMSLTDAERETMGKNGRRLVETKYTWPVVADEMKQAYEWLVDMKRDKPMCVHTIPQDIL